MQIAHIMQFSSTIINRKTLLRGKQRKSIKMGKRLAKFRANYWTLKLYIDKELAALEVLRINLKSENGGEEKELAGRRPLRMRRSTLDCGGM